MRLIAVLVLLSGCCLRVEVVDKRLTREEVALAFQQRDEALIKIVSAVKEINATKANRRPGSKIAAEEAMKERK